MPWCRAAGWITFLRAETRIWWTTYSTAHSTARLSHNTLYIAYRQHWNWSHLKRLFLFWDMSLRIEVCEDACRCRILWLRQKSLTGNWAWAPEHHFVSSFHSQHLAKKKRQLQLEGVKAREHIWSITKVLIIRWLADAASNQTCLCYFLHTSYTTTNYRRYQLGAFLLLQHWHHYICDNTVLRPGPPRPYPLPARGSHRSST